jgi:hypothetical protein
MVLAFFDNEGHERCTQGQDGQLQFIVEALSRFLAIFNKKPPTMAVVEWFFHWDIAPVHTATIVKA